MSIKEGSIIKIIEMMRVVFVDINLVLRLGFKSRDIEYILATAFLEDTGILLETSM
jgi:hypothetical protein